jgi:hypothetical protein
MLALELVVILIVALAAALAVAHALELPGKLRLDKQSYLVVQTIYYPGFTYAGASEGVGVLAILALILVDRPSGARLALLVASLVLLGLMHAAYWAITHPVNKIWTRNLSLDTVSAGFSRLNPAGRSGPANSDTDAVWRRARDVWEGSHVLRAVLGVGALLTLLAAALIQRPPQG